MIPPVIYRTWSTHELPMPFQQAWNFTQENNPKYTQYLFTDGDMNAFMRKYYLKHPIWGNRVFNAFHSINPMYGTARADLFRYALLFQKGGVYMDAKSAAKNISAIVRRTDGFVTAHWPYLSIVRFWSFVHLRKIKGEYQQWWLASTPRHPVMKRVINKTLLNIEQYQSMYEGKLCNSIRGLVGDSLVLYLVPSCKGVDILWMTGPFVFTKAVDEAMDHTTCDDVRILWPDGDETFVYDFVGVHRRYGGRYWTHGSPLVRRVSWNDEHRKLLPMLAT